MGKIVVVRFFFCRVYIHTFVSKMHNNRTKVFFIETGK